MARATTTHHDVRITLELTEEEALYIYGALNRTTPSPQDRFGEGGDDPVYTALGDVLKDSLRGLDYASLSSR